MNEQQKKFLNITIWVFAICLLLRLLISGQEIAVNLKSVILALVYSAIGYIGEAISVTAIIMAIFEKTAWRWPLLSKIHNVPILFANYVGSLKTDYDQNERNCELTIEQSFTTIKVKFKTGESSSHSITASIINDNGTQKLIYTYLNSPRAELQSPIHYGTVILDIDNPNQLEGNYYTNRGTKGSMSFEINNPSR